MCAAESGHVNVVDILLQHGARVDMKKTVSAQLTEHHLYLSQLVKCVARHKH